MSFSNRFIITQVLFGVLLLALAVVYKSASSNSGLPRIGAVQEFSLTSQDNTLVQLKDLKNEVWVADFVFTTCGDICPMMAKHMSRINKAFAQHKDVRMVSISVNPENDTPDVLKTYSKKYDANDKWIFLTGNRAQIQQLSTESFKMGDVKEIMFHSAMFVLVDRQGIIRGYYDSNDQHRIDQLSHDLTLLRKELVLPVLPTINATLNGLAGLLLFFGFMAIRQKKIDLHKRFMVSALLCSTLFLSCYIYYHATSHIITRYQGTGFWRSVYFFVLGTHTPLAALIVPFVIWAVIHAFRGEFDKHVKITRWLYPTWMYVSITGVIVYLMLYVFKPL